MNQENIWAYFQNEGATSFDGALPRYNYILKDIRSRLPASAQILNIGVGNGKLEVLLKEAGYSVSSLDPDKEAISKLQSIGIRALTGSIEAMPFEDNAFDGIIASEVLEHLEYQHSKNALNEVSRILKVDGYFFGTVPYRENLADNLTVCPHCAEKFHRWGHLQSFDKEKLISLIKDRFTLVTISRRSFVKWDGGTIRFLKSFFKWILGRLGEPISSPHFYFVLRKFRK